MSVSIEEDRYKALPPPMGFEHEEWFRDAGSYGPHYTCICNGRRIVVWVMYIAKIWQLSLAKPEYHTGECWSDKAEEEVVSVPASSPLLLMAAIHEITSEGNKGAGDEALHDLQEGDTSGAQRHRARCQVWRVAAGLYQCIHHARCMLARAAG